MSGRQKRLKAQLALSSLSSLLLFVGVGMWLATDQISLDSDSAVAFVWWVSLFASAGFGVAACQIDDDTAGDAHYLTSLVAGVRREWHHPQRSRQ